MRHARSATAQFHPLCAVRSARARSRRARSAAGSFLSLWSWPPFLLGEGKGCIADHLVARAGGVAGVAQVEQVRGEVMSLRRDDQAVDGGAAAGLVMRDGLAQLQDGLS